MVDFKKNAANRESVREVYQPSTSGTMANTSINTRIKGI
jgi:hypothetical protein